MSNEIQAYTDADLSYRIVMLKALTDLIKTEFIAAKRIAAEQYAKGAGIPARQKIDGLDVKLGRVTKSDPSPVATVTNQDEFESYLEVKFADTAVHEVILGDTSEICAALADAGREDLFTVVHRIPDWQRQERLKAALAGEKVPGVTVSSPDGVVSARTEKAATDIVVELLSASPVPLLSIEGGQA
jgi:hypothetical protein